MQSLNPLIPNFSVLKREYLANSLTRNSGQALNWHKYCTHGLKYISVSRFEVLFSESRLKTNKQKKDGWRLNFSPQAVGGAAGSPPPSGSESPPIHPSCIIKWTPCWGSGAGNLILCSGGEKRDSPSLFTSIGKTLISEWLEPRNLADFDRECWKQDTGRQEVEAVFNIHSCLTLRNTSLSCAWMEYLGRNNISQRLLHYKCNYKWLPGSLQS